MADEDFPDALPARYRLHWYVVERVLGQGGFGITYLAHDTNLDRRVAIKEYLPTEIARRRSDASARPRTETHNERYAWGLERFLAEARTLARFDHPNIVRVLSVFEANNTAYMVMRFEEGEDLATLLDRLGTVPEAQLIACLLPILDGLQLIHASGFIHRDIKPENIYVRQDGSPVLLDFGSARQSFGSSKTMTILVAPGYAPLEQYYGDAKTQGPWTDIYGLGATCYRAIAGRAPLDAIARAKGVLGSTRDILQTASEAGKGRYSDPLLAAVDHALQLSERNRPQSVAEWRKEVSAPTSEGSAAPQALAALSTPEPVVALPAGGADRAARPRRPYAWGAIAGVFALTAGAAYLGSMSRAKPELELAAVRVPSSRAPVQAVVTRDIPPLTASTLPVPARPDAAPSRSDPAPVTTVAATEAPVRIAPAKPPATRSEPSPSHAAAERLRPAPLVAPSTAARVAGDLAARATPAPVPAPVPDAGGPPLPNTVAVVSPPARPAAEASPASVARRLHDDQLEAAETALQRGDAAAAVHILAPLASTGVTRAQALLGRAKEARSQEQHNYFEAYVWYSIAARGGEAGAAASRDKLAPKLQPAEIRQAEQIAERWKSRPTSSATNNLEKGSP